MTTRINVSSGRPLEARAHYSRSLRVGESFLQSGTTAIDREGQIRGESVEAQVDAIFAFAAATLDAVDARLEDVVRARVFVVGANDCAAAERAVARHLGPHRPAITLVPIARLARPTQRIEIELEGSDGAARRAERFGSAAEWPVPEGATALLRLDGRVLASSFRGEATDPAELHGTVLRALEAARAARSELVSAKYWIGDLGFGDGLARQLGVDLASAGVRPTGSLIEVPADPAALWLETETISASAGARRESGSADAGPLSAQLAQAVRVGDRVAVGAVAPLRGDAVEALGDWGGQRDRCIERLGAALEGVGAGLGDVVNRRFLTRADAEMNRSYGEGPPWFSETRPAALGCRIGAHPHGDALIAMDAEAVLGAGEDIEWREVSV